MTRTVFLAAVTLKDKRAFPCVVFVEKDSNDQSRLFPRHGFVRTHYKHDESKMIDVKTVLSISPSPNVITSMELVRRICEHGHVDDPIHHAKLTFSDGTTQWTAAGYTYFRGFSDGHSADDVVGVEYPPEGYDRRSADSLTVGEPPWVLCIFKRPRDNV